MPGGNEAAVAEARACLAHLLDHVMVPDPHFGDPRRVRHVIEFAMEDGLEADAGLRHIGIRVLPHESGFVVANQGIALTGLFHGTRWAKGEHRAALRMLPGAKPWRSTKFEYNTAHLGTFLPIEVIDLVPTGRAPAA